MALTDQDRAEARRIRGLMHKASDYITDDKAASTIGEFYRAWAKADWAQYKKDAIRWHAGQLWKFQQPSLANESQNMEPGSTGSAALWVAINYKNGVKVIPFPRRALTTGEAFTASELGWWEGDAQAKRGVWQAPTAGATWPPGTTGVTWTFVRDEP